VAKIILGFATHYNQGVGYEVDFDAMSDLLDVGARSGLPWSMKY
jgi:hypothetical protein